MSSKKMIIKSAEFLISTVDASKCPSPHLPEYAFIGRSNVGKSSLINMITGRSELARTSSKPGKTLLINHFVINKNWYLVDLPGYGYAEVPPEKRAELEKLISTYLSKRENLMCTFFLIDSRLPLQKIDAEFMNWLGENGIPFVIVYTKMDKLSKGKTDANIEKIREDMLKTWEELPQQFYTSSINKSGKEELLEFIESTNKNYRSSFHSN